MKIYRVEFDARSMSTGEGIAQFPENCARMPPDGEPVKNWSVPLVAVPARNDWDFMPSNIRARVCSHRLVTLLREHESVRDYVQWLAIETERATQDEKWKVLHFAKPLPVLDPTRSKSLPTGALIKPAFDRGLIENLAFFSIPGAYMFEFFVNEQLKKEADHRKLHGLFFKLADDV